MAYDQTTFASLLKVMYPDKEVARLSANDHALLGLIPKDPSIEGSTYNKATIYSTPLSSASFAVAQTNANQSKHVQWAMSVKDHFSIANIAGKTIAMSRTQAGAFKQAVKEAMNAAYESLGKRAGQLLYGDGNGWIGRFVVGQDLTNNTVITLRDPDSVTFFEVGQRLCFSDGAGGTLRDTGQVVVVTAVDRAAGTVTLDTDLDEIASINEADYIVPEGDNAAVLSGLAAWVPDAAPAATAFFGIDRTADSRLGGLRINATTKGYGVEESLIEAALLIAREGGKPTHCFMNYSVFGKLQKEVGSKLTYAPATGSMGTAKIGYDAFDLITPKGLVKIVPDADCPGSRFYMGPLATLSLDSGGKFPDVLNEDGQTLRAVSDANSYQVRLGGYPQMSCTAPGHWCVVHTIP